MKDTLVSSKNFDSKLDSFIAEKSLTCVFHPEAG